MAISLQPVQLGLGMVLVLVSAILLLMVLKRRPKALLSLLVISAVILAGFACLAVFKNIYPEVVPGDNIRGEDESLLMGYYHNETVYRTEMNYDEQDAGHRSELDKKFGAFHPQYESAFEDYRNEMNSKFVNGMIGVGVGGLVAIIILVFFITGTGKRRRIKEEMELRDMFT